MKNISVNDKLKKELIDCNCEILMKDVWAMLKECNMLDGEYKIKLKITEGEFGNNTAHLMIIDKGSIVLTKTYNFSKMNKEFELKYSNYALS